VLCKLPALVYTVVVSVHTPYTTDKYLADR